MTFLLFCGTSQSVSFTLRFSVFPQGWPRNKLKMHLWLQKPCVSSLQAFCLLLCTGLCCYIRHTAVGSPHKDAVSWCHPWGVSWSPSGIRDSWPRRRDRAGGKPWKARLAPYTEQRRLGPLQCPTLPAAAESHMAGVLWEQLWTPTEPGSPRTFRFWFISFLPYFGWAMR